MWGVELVLMRFDACLCVIYRIAFCCMPLYVQQISDARYVYAAHVLVFSFMY